MKFKSYEKQSRPQERPACKAYELAQSIVDVIGVQLFHMFLSLRHVMRYMWIRSLMAAFLAIIILGESMVDKACSSAAPEGKFPDAAHMRLIRKLSAFWSPVESGAPWIESAEPLGEGDTKQLAAEITGLSEEEAHCKLLDVVERLYLFIEKARLEPGEYVLPEDLRNYMDEEHGVGPDGRFTLKNEHLLLLRSMRWHEAPPEQMQELLDDGIYPFPLAEPKRPYGDYTWYQYEMAEILDEPYALNDNNEVVEDPDKDQRLQTLHYETLPALQLLLLYGDMP